MDLSVNEMQQQLEKHLGIDGWKLTPATFASVASEGLWHPARHLQYVSLIIATELAKGNARVIVSMPPRHGKSELLSIWTAIWLLDRDPSTEIILASYGAELATDFSRKVRDRIRDAESPESPLDLQCQLRADVQRQAGFLTTEGGGMRAMGIEGTITGRGADVFLIDDYLKNPKEAASETKREDIWDSFRSVCRTRLEPGGSIIILATRWHLDDLIGRCIANNDEDEEFKNWTYIDLAAHALPGDVLGREVGEALWPERWPLKALNALKHDLGTYFWECMFQQKPIPRSGGQVKESHFPIVDILPAQNRLKSVRFWDLAGTIDAGDYTAGLLMEEDIYTGINYISDVKRKQLSAEGIENLLANTAEEDTALVKVGIEQEPGAAGKNYISHLARKVLKGYIVEGVRPTGDKFIRAQPFFASAQAGNVRLKRGPWNKQFIEECILFPDGSNDDQVDCASGAYNKLNGKVYQGITFGRKNRNTDGPGVVRGNQNASGKIVSGVTFGRGR